MNKCIKYFIILILLIPSANALTLNEAIIIKPNSSSFGHYILNKTAYLDELNVNSTYANLINLDVHNSTVAIINDAGQVIEIICEEVQDCSVPQTNTLKKLLLSDIISPTITNYEFSPPNQSTWSDGLFHKFNITCEDISGCHTSLIEVNGVNYTNTSFVNGEYEFNLGGLPAGTYKIKFYINDSSGNMVINDTGSYVLNKATPNPILFINNSQSNANQEYKNGASFNITALLNTSTEKKYLDINLLWNLSGDILGTGDLIKNITKHEDVGLIGIRYSAHVESNENYTDASENFTIHIVDTTFPKITIRSPSNNTYYPNNTIWFNITIEEELIDIVQVEINGTNHSLTNSSGNWNYLNNSLSNNTWAGRFYVIDTSGNSNDSEIVYFNIDLDIPSITLTSPEPGACTNGSSKTFQFVVTDLSSPTLNCSLYIDNVLNMTNSSVLNDTTTSFTLEAIENANNWSISCKDLAGNEVFSENRTLTSTRSASFLLNKNQDTYVDGDSLQVYGELNNTGCYDLSGDLSGKVYDKYGVDLINTMSCNITSISLKINPNVGLNCSWTITNLVPDDYLARLIYNWTSSYSSRDTSFKVVSSGVTTTSVTESIEEPARKEVSIVEEAVAVIDRFGRATIGYIKVKTTPGVE